MLHPSTTIIDGQIFPITFPDLPRHDLQLQSNEIVVERLSSHCDENQIRELFLEYGHVMDVTIHQYPYPEDICLYYGLKHYAIITMTTASEARHMKATFNGHLFMGRRLRVSLFDDEDHLRPYMSGYRVDYHFQSEGEDLSDEVITTAAMQAPMIVPAEVIMRRLLLTIGIGSLDIALCHWNIDETNHTITGHGYVVLLSDDNVRRLCTEYSPLENDDLDVLYSFTFSLPVIVPANSAPFSSDGSYFSSSRSSSSND